MEKKKKENVFKKSFNKALKKITNLYDVNEPEEKTIEELAKEYLEVYLEQYEINIQSEEDLIPLKIELQGLPNEFFEDFFMNYGLNMSELEKFKDLLSANVDNLKPNILRKQDERIKMEELVEKFLDEYALRFDCNWADEVDATKLLESIRELEEFECKDFFKENNIEESKFSEFSRLATDAAIRRVLRVSNHKKEQENPESRIAPELLADFEKSASKMRNESQIEEIANKILKYMDWENIAENLKNNFYGLIIQMKKADLKEYVSKVTEENLCDAELIALKNMLLDKMEDRRTKDEPDTTSELLYPAKNSQILNHIDVYLEEVLNNGTSKSYDQIIDDMINELKNTFDLNKSELEYLKKVVQIRYQEKSQKLKDNLSFYQKILNVFQTLDYDHLSETQKENLAENIKNGHALKYHDVAHLNISEEEYYKIKNYIVAELNKNRKRKDSKNIKIVLDYYLDQIIKDYTYYEKFCMEITAEKIKKEKPEFEAFTDQELQGVMDLIKKEGKEIAIVALVNLPEISWSNMVDKMSQSKSLEELQKNYQVLLEEIHKTKLSAFNKNLLIEHAKELMETKKKTFGYSNEINNLINKVKKIAADSNIEEILEFYHTIQEPDAKKELNCENLSDEEFANTIKIMQDILNDELANKILADLKKEYPNDNLKELVENWEDKRLKKYNIPTELKKPIQEKIKAKLKSKNDEKDELKDVLEIGTKVSLTKEIKACENLNDFKAGISSKEKLKKGKKGKIASYVVQKDNEQKEIKDKKELEKSLKNGYQLVGYNLSYRGKFFKKKQTFVKKEDVNPSISMIKNIWKKIKKHPIRSIVVGLAALGVVSYFAGKTYYNNLNDNENQEENMDDLEQNPLLAGPYEPLVPDEASEPEEEINIDKEYESIPSMGATMKTPTDLDSEKIIYATINDIGTDNKSTAYYKSDSEKIVDGICLESPEGIRKVYQNTDEIIDLMTNYGYKYIGTRIVNENSYDQNGNIKSYEGYYGAESINLQDVEESLARRRTK